MSLILFKEDQTEDYYRKLLLLDKVKPFLEYEEKQYIFTKNLCWDILFNDKDASEFSLYYAKHIINGRYEALEPIIAKDGRISYYYSDIILDARFELGEPAIAKEAGFSYLYAKGIIKGRFRLGEPAIMRTKWRKKYLEYLETII